MSEDDTTLDDTGMSGQDTGAGPQETQGGAGVGREVFGDGFGAGGRL